MKVRLDQLMLDRGLAGDLRVAKATIMAGQVRTQGRTLDKPGMMVDDGAEIELKSGPEFVSRAGGKLASVAAELDLDFAGKVVLDVGSSTGGFTDFALGRGAAKVYCVDVGTGQLDWRLRQDPRVVIMEQTDIRDARLPEQADVAVVDVSFVSLKRVLEPTRDLSKPGAPIVAMAKPQFEASRAVANKFRGVISDEEVRRQVIGDLRSWIRERFEILGEADSGVKGTEGNIERFFLLRAKV
jgi:23S rRNA (cytidine1920-2'-O)/16S rRNA (cytidine1409-2'-O)-methyltransferase